MNSATATTLLGLALILGASAGQAAERAVTPKKSPSKTSTLPASGRQPKKAIEGVEALTARTQPSIVTVSAAARNGAEGGVGTGFVVDASGLIATCLHVIGEGRPITVTTADGARLEVTEVHAWDRRLDLAVLRVKTTKLTPLFLGDSEGAPQGAGVIALGNPMGLRHSVVQGVISAKREFNGIDMLQLAIPVEPGNSGGPVVGGDGRVLGIVSMKSAMTPNLGFAIPVDHLKTLLEKPNRVPFARWRQLHGLDTAQWAQSMGATWNQRPGRIEVSGLGTGFGGRTLCLSTLTTPAPICELSVQVKLGTEEGAAGLVFGSDGADRHYGFYPSAGALRLTRFDGPTVFNWNILQQVRHPAYRPGAWNELRVRHSPGLIQCYVNGQLAIESKDDAIRTGQVGLVAFRETPASFKAFRVDAAPPSEAPQALTDAEALLTDPASPAGTAARLASSTPGVLREKAASLEKQARQLRSLAAEVHQAQVQAELARILDQPDASIDLAHAALLVGKLDHSDLDVEAYRTELSRMAREVRTATASIQDPGTRLKALDDYLFRENGFHGSRLDYYDPSNSDLSSVIEDREGIPITLAILYLHLAKEAGIGNVTGLPLPGHFLVKHAPTNGKERIIDVFESGKTLTYAEADELGTSHADAPVRSEFLTAATPREIITRMLRNLHGIASGAEQKPESLRYLDTIIAINPDSAADRLARAQLRLQKGLFAPAKEDLKWILDKAPSGVDLDRIAELYRSLGDKPGF